LFERLVNTFQSQMYQLFHTFRRTMTTSHTRIFGPRGQTYQTIGKSTGITIHGKFGIPTAKDNAATDERNR
jgi:hypothetical protein